MQTLTGKLCGVDAVFGGRWDDLRSNAPLKSTHEGVTVYYDDPAIDLKSIPAPAVIQRAIATEDVMAASAVFYKDAEDKIFGSVIFSGGQVAPLSETVYESPQAWMNAIARATNDNNIDVIHLPGGLIRRRDEKHRFYDASVAVETKGLPRLSSASNTRTLLGGIAIAAVIAVIGGGVWYSLSDPFSAPAEQIVMVTERFIPAYDKVIESCRRDLNTPWPSGPEWTLVQEGCIPVWNAANVTFSAPGDQKPYAYRLYDLDTNVWDEYLSKMSFLKIAERFPGNMIQGTNQFLLYITYDIENRQVDDAYLADTNPAEIVRSNFLGSARIQGGAGVGGASASIEMELDAALARISGKRLSPNHLYQNLQTGQTVLEFGPEAVQSRQVRIR